MPGLPHAGSATRVLFAPTLQLTGADLTPLYNSIPGERYIENDATSSGHAEWFTRGAVGNMAYVSLEGGVGGSVLIGGSPYHGTNQRSCEFGHMCIVPGGAQVLLRQARLLRGVLLARPASARTSVSRSASSSTSSRGTTPSSACSGPTSSTTWAVGIANIRMAFDCDVVLGGELSQYLPPYLGLLRQFVAANDPFSDNADYVSLSVLGGHSVPLGAALHFISKFLDEV